MIIDPVNFKGNREQLELIEKATLRFVTQAIFDFRESAEEIFKYESDLVADIGEDITREALETIGVSKVDQRLFGKIDYKRARYFSIQNLRSGKHYLLTQKLKKFQGKERLHFKRLNYL